MNGVVFLEDVQLVEKSVCVGLAAIAPMSELQTWYTLQDKNVNTLNRKNTF